MIESGYTVLRLLSFLHVAVASVAVILAFSLMAYMFTYNFRSPVARRFAWLLFCVMIPYASEVALMRVDTPESAERWLRFEWLGIAFLPAAYYAFSLSVLQTTNYRIHRRQGVAATIFAASILSAASALLGRQLVGDVRFAPPISYLTAGPYFSLFALFFVLSAMLAMQNVWKARARCLTESSRKRMSYLLWGFVAPGLGVFPYLIALSRAGVEDASGLVLLTAIIGNLTVIAMIVLMSYTVVYFGVLTPDRVVRYRLLRFFMRGPVVAILVILSVQTLPTVERILGLPRDMVLFSVITGVIIASQLALSISKVLVDRLVYREDHDEVAWLRELDRRLLTTSDLRQFLENNLSALCELLRVPSGFVAAIVGPDLVLEAVVGPDNTRNRVTGATDWGETLSRLLKEGQPLRPRSHAGFWLWPLLETSDGGDSRRVLGILGVDARTETPLLSLDEMKILAKMVERITSVLADRRLQQNVFVALRQIIPEIERIQQWRGVIPYTSQESDLEPTAALLDPSPIHSPEFEDWVKDALSHYWGGPKLTLSPLVQLRVVKNALARANGEPTRALRLVLGSAIERLKPEGKPNLSAPEWLLYNILEMRFIQGRKVREIADRLAMSESDLYRKQRVAIGQVARVLSEMEQINGSSTTTTNAVPMVDGAERES